jgi:hypothetical protein
MEGGMLLVRLPRRCFLLPQPPAAPALQVLPRCHHPACASAGCTNKLRRRRRQPPSPMRPAAPLLGVLPPSLSVASQRPDTEGCRRAIAKAPQAGGATSQSATAPLHSLRPASNQQPARRCSSSSAAAASQQQRGPAGDHKCRRTHCSSWALRLRSAVMRWQPQRASRMASARRRTPRAAGTVTTPTLCVDTPVWVQGAAALYAQR